MSGSEATPRHDWRDQPPVEEPIPRPEKASQSLLGRMDVCQRSAYLYVKHRGGVQSHEMARGEVFHDFAERWIETLVEQQEPTGPPDVAKELMGAILAERKDLTIPEHEQEALRVMAWHFAEGTWLDVEALAGTELMLEAEYGAWTVRGKLDRLEVRSTEAWIRDYKTSLNLPRAETIERDFLTQFYALLAADGRVEGNPLPIAAGVELFHVELIYPRYINPETGELATRYADYTRAELADFRATVEGHLEKLDAALESGRWPAVPGPHCGTCAAPSECPIPAHLRPVQTIENLADAEDAAVRIEYLAREVEQLRKNAKAWADANGPIFYGDYVLDFSFSESEEIKDKVTLREAIERTIEFGDPFDWDAHVRRKKSTRFSRRKRTEEEAHE